LSITILALFSLSAVVYHGDVIAARGGNGGGNGGGNADGGNESASDAKGGNASNTGKASRAAHKDEYELWLLELLKESFNLLVIAGTSGQYLAIQGRPDLYKLFFVVYLPA